MINKLVLIIVLAFLLIPFAAAVDTLISIKTLPYHEVQLTTFNANSESFSAFESFKGESDMYGDIIFTFSSNEPTFSIIVYIKFNHENVISKKFDDKFAAGEPIYLEVAPPGARIIETPDKELVEEESLTITEPFQGISAEATETEIKIDIQNTGEELTMKSASLDFETPSEAVCNDVTKESVIDAEATETLVFDGCNGLTAGEMINADITITYTNPDDETEATSTGTLSEKILVPVITEITEPEQTTTAKSEKTNSQSGITGFTIFSDSLKKSTVFYIIGIFLIAAVAIFVFKIRKRAVLLQGFKGFKESKLSSAEINESTMIESLEKKVEDAQKELKILKNQEKIKEAEKRMQLDQEELEKLRRGEI